MSFSDLSLDLDIGVASFLDLLPDLEDAGGASFLEPPLELLEVGGASVMDMSVELEEPVGASVWGFSLELEEPEREGDGGSLCLSGSRGLLPLFFGCLLLGS